MAFYFRGIIDYYQSFFKNLYELRQDATFCDVKLQVNEEIFMAHRIVLMSGSAYFHAMFATEMSEHHKDEVMIGGVTPSIFKALLDFIYSGIFSVDWLQSLKQFFINVSYHLLVARLTLMALF